jgi:hypothetical protein
LASGELFYIVAIMAIIAPNMTARTATIIAATGWAAIRVNNGGIAVRAFPTPEIATPTIVITLPTLEKFSPSSSSPKAENKPPSADIPNPTPEIVSPALDILFEISPQA